MDRNLEGKDSKNTGTNESADFSNHTISVEDQQAVFKRNAQSNSKDVHTLDLDNSDNSERVRKIDFPHNWYEASQKTPYSIPSQFVTGVESTLKQGWSKLQK